ncbi:MAG: ornithine carbamoyltransferase, partial [Acidobacteriota bacterium]|nr:ornithine carbamoyltransferase [Acidobacteriota bacterium]
MWEKDLISIHDLDPRDVSELFELAADIKIDAAGYSSRLAGKTLALIFQKSSTRTRVSFEVGMFQLGGHALFLSSRDIQLGRGESIEDTAKVLSRYVDGVMARTYAHQDVVDLARFGTIPVINGLTDELHPCQALADFFTLSENFEDLSGRRVAYIGDGNNMAHSLMLAAPKVGVDIAVASPEGFVVSESYAAKARQAAERAGTRVVLTR